MCVCVCVCVYVCKCSTLPVHEIESMPGPWYSIMAPVPPATVNMSATFKMTSRAV